MVAEFYVINGRKRFISNAGLADFYTVFARTGTRPDGRAEISAFIVGARMQGVSVSERIEMISPHPIGELEFSNCRVPAEDMIGSVRRRPRPCTSNSGYLSFKRRRSGMRNGRTSA